MFPVSLEKEKILQEKLNRLEIYEDDIKESFIRSQGKGGQKVNKTSSCVYLKHIPSGMEVKCQKTRSQGLNRYYARVLLFEKIEKKLKGEKSEEAKRIAKIRRQKRKRSKRAKEKILEEKKLVSIKKERRSFKYDTEQ